MDKVKRGVRGSGGHSRFGNAPRGAPILLVWRGRSFAREGSWEGRLSIVATEKDKALHGLPHPRIS